MWFDDDSYIDDHTRFWPDLMATLLEQQPDQAGQIWRMSKLDEQRQWLQQQYWYGCRASTTDRFVFCTGGFWLARRSMLQRLNYPFPELRHCGGDTLLSEAVRCSGGKIVSFDTGVRINADSAGRHSKAARRGYSERPFANGKEGPGRWSVEHQNFETLVKIFKTGETESWNLSKPPFEATLLT
jgi:hypothetical protein